jgi:hypothetical protein
VFSCQSHLYGAVPGGLARLGAFTTLGLSPFGRPGSKRENSSGAFPQIRVVGLAECGTHAIIELWKMAQKTGADLLWRTKVNLATKRTKGALTRVRSTPLPLFISTGRGPGTGVRS